MKRARVIVFVVVLAIFVAIAIRAGYLNTQGRPDFGTSLALGLAAAALSLVNNLPQLRPPPVPALVVTNPGAAPGKVFAQDAAGFDYTRGRSGKLYRFTDAGPIEVPEPLPAAWWNWPARGYLLLVWPARAALAGYAAYYTSTVLSRDFNLRLLEFSVAAQGLYHLRRIGLHLAGFQLDWSSYRGWALVRKLANAAFFALLAGYAFVVTDLLDEVLLWIPRHIYRGLDGLWHLPWFNIPIVVVASIIVFLVLSIIVSWIQGRLARALGPGNALGEKLEQLRLIKWN